MKEIQYKQEHKKTFGSIFLGLRRSRLQTQKCRLKSFESFQIKIEMEKVEERYEKGPSHNKELKRNIKYGWFFR